MSRSHIATCDRCETDEEMQWTGRGEEYRLPNKWEERGSDDICGYCIEEMKEEELLRKKAEEFDS